MLAHSEFGEPSPHSFGGDWTDKKLVVVSRYLSAYNTALSKQRFKRAYIDAFAGSPYRKRSIDAVDKDGLLFPDLADVEAQSLRDGSARSALQTDPPFDTYVFIERNAARCSQLDELKRDFPAQAEAIRVVNGEANAEIQALCAKNWRWHRAVLILDPYGMQVDWTTIEAVAKTHAIDLWLLVPLGIGLQRLLTRRGNIPHSWSKRLNRFLGHDNWRHDFYRDDPQGSLFDSAPSGVTRVAIDSIAHIFVDRLRSVFAGVSDRPGILRNTTNCPLYMLCFATANERGKDVALRIANHLLQDLR